MEKKRKKLGILQPIRTEIRFSGENLRINARAMVFALVAGLVVGVVGGGFARLLDLAVQFREGVSWAIFLLPFAGLPVVWMYRRGGIRTAGGTDIIVQAARGEQPVSRVLAPVIFASTLLTHFFGGSAGREGAALQLGGSLAELVRKRLRIGDEFEDLAIMCGMSAGFSAVFGNQISAVIFALEISCVGMLPMGALFPCVVSSITAGHVARAMGERAVTYYISASTPNALFYGKVLVLAVACGLLSILVCYTFSGVRKGLEHLFPNPYLRVMAGGVLVVVLTLLLGTKYYLGSGQALIDQSVGKGGVPALGFPLKTPADGHHPGGWVQGGRDRALLCHRRGLWLRGGAAAGASGLLCRRRGHDRPVLRRDQLPADLPGAGL